MNGHIHDYLDGFFIGYGFLTLSVEVPTFNLMYGGAPIGPVGPVAPMLPTGLYGGVFGLNGAPPHPGSAAVTTANGVGFLGPGPPNPAAAAAVQAPTAAQPPPPYWQPADATPLLGYHLRPAVFAAQPANSGVNGAESANGASAGGGGGDLLKLFTNPFEDVSFNSK